MVMVRQSQETLGKESSTPSICICTENVWQYSTRFGYPIRTTRKKVIGVFGTEGMNPSIRKKKVSRTIPSDKSEYA